MASAGEALQKRNDEAKDTIKKLDDIQKNFEVEYYKSSAERSKESGNPGQTPPDAIPRIGPLATQAADVAAGAISAARAQLEGQLVANARLASDPRYERDQEVFMAGKRGELPLVPPSEAEAIATAQRSGASPEVIDALPKTPEEQVSDDMARLEQAKARKEELTGAIVPGQQEGAPRNNLSVMEAAGKHVGGKTTDASNVNENRPSAEEKAAGPAHVIK